jgi:hypothetical protein
MKDTDFTGLVCGLLAYISGGQGFVIREYIVWILTL